MRNILTHINKFLIGDRKNLKKSQHDLLPEEVANFYLKEELFADKIQKKFYYGLYRDKNGRSAFGKMWSKKIINENYHLIKNEIKIYKYLSQHKKEIASLAKRYNVIIPELLYFSIKKNKVFFLLEYINGVPLKELSKNEQAVVYKNIFDFFEKLNEKISFDETDIIRRPPTYWKKIIHLIAFIASIKYPKYILQILKRYFFLVRNTKYLQQSNAFTHRDFSGDNIIVSPKGIYIFDFQLGCLASPTLEIAACTQSLYHDKETFSFYEEKIIKPKIAEQTIAQEYYYFNILLSLYDLAMGDGRGVENSVDFMKQSTIMIKKQSNSLQKNNKTKQIFSGVKLLPRVFSFLTISLLVIFTSIILMLTLRGNMGSPPIDEMISQAWQDNGPFELSPERGRFALTYSIIENHSVIFDIPTARFTNPDTGYINGNFVSLFAPGVSFILIPGYILGKYFGAVQLGTYAVISLFSIFNICLIYYIVKKITQNIGASFLAAISFVFASPAFAYAVSLYQHHISTFLILLSLFILIRFKGLFSLVFIWFLCVLSIPIDYPNLFIMAPIAIFALARLFVLQDTSIEKKITFKAAGIFTFIPAILPLLFFFWFNYASYGHPLQFSGTIETVKALDEKGKIIVDPTDTRETIIFSDKGKNDNLLTEPDNSVAISFFEPRDLVNGLYVHLFSPDRGILFYTPLMLLGTFGAVILYKQNKSLAALITSIISMNLILYAMWGDPWGGWAFGSRYMIPSYAMLSILIGVSLARYYKNIFYLLLFLLLFIYSVSVNALGALTSNQNPPQVEILALEKISGTQELYSYDRNYQLISRDVSKSFLWNIFFNQYVNAYQYYQILVVLIAVPSLFMVVVTYFSGRKNYEIT